MLTTMKKIILLLTSLLFVSTYSFAISPPTTIRTGVAAYNADLGAVGVTNCLDNFDDLTNTSNAFLSYARPIVADPNNYAFVVESRSTNALNDLLGVVATSAELEPIYIRNTGRNNINYFGGLFHNVSPLGNSGTDSLKITFDNSYVYRYKPTPGTTFVGFIFSEGFSEVKIESMATNSANRCPAISRVIWGSNLIPTSINEPVKPVVIFPNPTADGITVNATGTVSVLSTAGQILVNQAVTKGSYVSLSGIPNGLYIVKIETATGSVQDKLIKK